MTDLTQLVDNHNGRFLVLKGDQWIRHGIENVDLLGFELQKFDRVLDVISQLRPFQKDVVDGGSNMGSWTIPLAKSHPMLNFHMFEVQRFLWLISCGNLALNNIQNAHPRWCGLGDSQGHVQIRVPDYSLNANYGSFEVRPPFANSDCVLVYTDQVHTVPVTTIDSLDLNPALIKLDVEGMEWSCLQGAARTIQQFQPVVWCERQKSNPSLVIPWFEAQDYKLSMAIEGHWTFLPQWLNSSQALQSLSLF
jgi:FkbM family methyltransferase